MLRAAFDPRINGALEGDKLPFLCRDRDSVGLIIPIVARAQEARIKSEDSKAQSLMEVAARLKAGPAGRRIPVPSRGRGPTRCTTWVNPPGLPMPMLPQCSPDILATCPWIPAFRSDDLDEVRQFGFHFFAAGVHVSHGYAHLEDFNRPVRVFGMTVHPGDLIHADKHGAVVIPAEVAGEVAAAARRVDEAERPMIALCRAPELDLDALDKLISPDY